MKNKNRSAQTDQMKPYPNNCINLRNTLIVVIKA